MENYDTRTKIKPHSICVCNEASVCVYIYIYIDTYLLQLFLNKGCSQNKN